MVEGSHDRTFDVELMGCRPEPLASYLKALGVLRLVAEQKDSGASGFWRGEHFVLRSKLDHDALERFFIDEWCPTPVLAPWNGGSGFWPSTSDEALRRIEKSSEPRLAPYASAIGSSRAAISALRLAEAPEKGEPKTTLLTHLRAIVSDEVLAWLDAAAVLTDEEPIYPALLGTGGNDGRQDFSNNFMQRVLAVFDDHPALVGALFGAAGRHGAKGSMGQFSPTSLDRSNGWDFVLSIEGSLMLAGAATRRLESRGATTLAFPFHARAAVAPSLADGEEGHGEIWLPLWLAPATFRAVRALFAEGRVKTGNGTAATGLDFARSISDLGVDRGLSEFIRYSFKARNGKNYFATPLGRFATREVPAVRLLDDINGWFERLRLKSVGKDAPARVAVAARRLEQAMFDVTLVGAVGPVLLALGDAERALAQSLAFAANAFLSPVPVLKQAWATETNRDLVEQRLAAALAARPRMRERLVPLDELGRNWGRGDEPGFVFAEQPLVENLHALLLREDIEDTQQTRGAAPEVPYARCSLTDIARFIDGDTDDVLLERWLRAWVLVEGGLVPEVPADTLLPPALFAVLGLVYHRRIGDLELPRTTGVLTRACAGDAMNASTAAIRRLGASGRPFPAPALIEPTPRTRRIAAALAFPLTATQRRTLESMVLPAVHDAINSTTTESSQEHA